MDVAASFLTTSPDVEKLIAITCDVLIRCPALVCEQTDGLLRKADWTIQHGSRQLLITLEKRVTSTRKTIEFRFDATGLRLPARLRSRFTALDALRISVSSALDDSDTIPSLIVHFVPRLGEDSVGEPLTSGYALLQADSGDFSLVPYESHFRTGADETSAFDTFLEFSGAIATDRPDTNPLIRRAESVLGSDSRAESTPAGEDWSSRE
jgi:hypothetical protein